MTGYVKHGLGRVTSLLFFSGACALIYQTTWFRELRLIFGASTAATAAVMAVFMAGLGLGSHLLGKRADRAKNPLELYANLELLIAVTAALTPLLVEGAQWVYLRTGGSGALGTAGATAVRLLLSVVVLAGPTILMGGTLPAAARAVERSSDVGRQRLSVLYGVNTFGAVAGALAANFLFLEVFGTRLSLWLTCLINALVGVIARSLSRRGLSRAEEEAEEKAEEPAAEAKHVEEQAAETATTATPGAPWFPPAAAFISGAVFMLMELVWYRMLAPILGGSSYTFGLILAVALAGIGIGGTLYSRTRRVPTVTLFAVTCAVEGLVIAIPFALGDRIALLSLLLRPLASSGFGASVLAWTIIAAIVVLPGAIVSGAQFPLIVGLYGKGASNVGRDVGAAYVANTLGAIVGSIAGGFGLIPALSAPTCWRLVVAILCLTAIAALIVDHVRLGRRDLRVGMVAAATALLGFTLLGARGPTAAWRHSGIGAGRADRRISDSSPGTLSMFVRNHQGMVAWEEDGLESTVAVGSGSGHAFIINGKADGHSINDAPTQVMSGLLGALVHPDPHEALVIGLGTGSTAGWLGALPEMNRVDVVELEPATLRVARDCADVNQNVLDNPKVKIHLGDARETLLTTTETYDVIFSEPSNPYRAGISSLYTEEFYTAASRRLRPNGIFIQWIQAYEVDPWAVATAMVTLHRVFPEISVWRTMGGDLLLLGQREPLKLNVAALRERLKTPVYGAATRSIWQTDSIEGVLTHFVANARLAEVMAANELGAVNHDDANVLEFAFARSVGHHVGVDNDIIMLANRLHASAPPLDGSISPIGVVEERWLDQTRNNQPLDPPTSGVPPHARGLGRVLSLYKENRFAEALQQWRGLHRAPRWVLEKSLVAEMAVRSQAQDADELVDRVMNEAERELLRALLVYRRGDAKRAFEFLEHGLALHRKDPWVRGKVSESAINVTVQIATREPTLARPLYEILSHPLAAEAQRDLRLYQRARIGAQIDPQHCAKALHEIEPAPYVDWLTELRVECYRDTGDPLLASAEADLRDVIRWQGTFGGSIPSPPPEGPHPFQIQPAAPPIVDVGAPAADASGDAAPLPDAAGPVDAALTDR